ncbi:MAG: hypothetical protein LC744_06585 [Chloroflexi bacterium]|nr:hypothetical protein [Chloroflexota bacterium]
MLREAASDLYYHSPRLIAGNLLWGVVLLASLWFGLAAPPLLLIGGVILVPISIGIMRMATSVVREGHTVLSDFSAAFRPRAWRHLALGLGQLMLLVVAAVDLLIGVQLGGMLGTFLALSAIYMLFAVWGLGVTCWPVLLDPVRAEEPIRQNLRLGVAVALAGPVRLTGVALLLAACLAASTILAALLLTVAVAFVFLVAAHYVLPAADRLEGRETLEVSD